MTSLGMYQAGMQSQLFHAQSPSTLLRSSQGDALSFTPQQSQQQQLPPAQRHPSTSQDAVSTGAAPSTLAPHQRAQVLVREMAGLTSRLIELAGNKIWPAGHNKTLGIHQFLPSATIPAQGLAASTPREVLAMIESHQALLSSTMSDIQQLQHMDEEKRRIAEAVAEKDASLRAFTKRLRDAEQLLDSTVEEYDCYKRPNCGESADTVGLGAVDVQELVAYAHRISYTTFAPPEFADGQNPLRNALPPAPQDEQMRASQLYLFSDMDVGLPKPAPTHVPSAEGDAKVEAEPHRVQATLPTMPPGWKPGMPVELPSDIPPMPAGWKPGQPINFPEGMPPIPQGWKPGDAVVLPQQVAQRAAVPPPSDILLKSRDQPPPPPAPAAPQPGVIQVPFVQLDLNPELEDEYGSEYSEDFASSDEDDD